MTTAPPPAEAVDNRRWFVLILVCIAQFMVVLDATITNVALPSIQTGLDFSPTSLQWVVNAYTLAFGGFLLLGGRAADFVGRRRLFVIGIVVFTVASLICGLAESSSVLIAARALQGLGAAMVSPAALSIVTTTFREGPERTKALSVWAAIAVGGAAIGLLLGGVLTEYLSWEWVFFVNVADRHRRHPAVAALRARSRRQADTNGIDVLGAISVTAGLTLLVYAIVKTQDYGWLSVETIGMAIATAALLIAFVFIETALEGPAGAARHLPQPLADRRQPGDAGGDRRHVRRVLLRLAVRAADARLHAGPDGPGLHARSPRGSSCSRAWPSSSSGGSGSSRSRSPACSWRPSACCCWRASRWTAATSATSCPGILVMSAGLGLTFVPMTLIATTGVSDADAGLASGLFNSSQQIGGALGLAILSTVAASTTVRRAAERRGLARPSRRRRWWTGSRRRSPSGPA